MSNRRLLDTQDGVQLWEVRLAGAPGVVAYFLSDDRRTPETWNFTSEVEARAKYDERVERAKTHPSLK